MQADTTTTILVTGSNGNIGSELIRQLSNSSSDLNLKAAVRSGDDTPNIIANNNSANNYTKLQQVVIDFNRPQTILDGLKNVDKLFILTPTHPKMVEFTSNLVNEAKKSGVKHIVKLSHIRAGDEEQEAQINITRLHHEAEKIIEDSAIPFTFLRPNFFMQNFVNFYLTKNQSSIYLPAGDGKVSFVDIRDIAAVAAQALLASNNNDGGVHAGKSYTLTGPEAISYGDTVEILSGYLGRKISYVNISEEDARQLLQNMGFNEWHSNVLLELLRITKEGYLSDVYSSIEQITGNKPLSFHRFAKDYASSLI
jgi:uncharacterized protein YbjT (DUF2867 family)